MPNGVAPRWAGSLGSAPSDTLSPGISTPLPIIDTASIDCDTSICPLMASMVFLRLLMPSTVEICAS